MKDCGHKDECECPRDFGGKTIAVGVFMLAICLTAIYLAIYH